MNITCRTFVNVFPYSLFLRSASRMTIKILNVSGIGQKIHPLLCFLPEVRETSNASCGERIMSGRAKSALTFRPSSRVQEFCKPRVFSE